MTADATLSAGSSAKPATPPTVLTPLHQRLSWLSAGIVVALAAALRFSGLAEFWLNPDEGIYYSVIAWPDLAQRQAEIAANAHPPLFYHLLWLWSRVSMEFAWLRALPAIAGTVSVLGVFLLGRDLIGGTRGVITGLVAALLLAIAPAAITLSQVIRPYTLQMALLVFAMLGLVRYCDRGNRRALAMFSVCAAIALLTHYSSVFVLVAAAAPVVALLAQKKLSRRARVDFAVALALPFAAGLTIYLTHIATQLAGTALHTHAFQTWLRPHLATSPFHAWLQVLGLAGYTFSDAWSGTGVAALGIALGVAAWQRAPRIWLVPTVVFGLAVTASLLHKYPFGPARHSAYLMPFLVLPIGWAIARGLTATMPGRGITVAVVGALLLLRAPIYDLLSGGFRVSTLGSEKVLRRDDLPRMQAMLDQLKATPGLLATSDDSYHTLCPLWLLEREAARVVDGVRVFRWGARDVVVHPGWAFSMQGADVGKGDHLFDFLVKADAALPEYRLAQQTRLPVLFAGFHILTMQALAQFDVGRESTQRLVHNSASVPGLGLLDLDAALFVREARAELTEDSRAPASGGR